MKCHVEASDLSGWDGFVLFLFRDLKAREGTVLGWEWDDNHRIHQLPAIISNPAMFPLVLPSVFPFFPLINPTSLLTNTSSSSTSSPSCICHLQNQTMHLPDMCSDQCSQHVRVASWRGMLFGAMGWFVDGKVRSEGGRE